jgi:hypothetical protein
LALERWHGGVAGTGNGKRPECRGCNEPTPDVSDVPVSAGRPLETAGPGPLARTRPDVDQAFAAAFAARFAGPVILPLRMKGPDILRFAPGRDNR